MQEMTFPQAIAKSNELIDRLEKDGAPPNFQALLRDIVSTENGARAFFVSLLTGNFRLADEAPDYLIDALTASPTLVSEILTKNLVMSTAMEHAHTLIGDHGNAAGSRRVSRRTAALLGAIITGSTSLAPVVRLEVERMILGLGGRLAGRDVSDEQYASFLNRWSYDETQMELAKTALLKVLNPDGETD